MRVGYGKVGKSDHVLPADSRVPDDDVAVPSAGREHRIVVLAARDRLHGPGVAVVHVFEGNGGVGDVEEADGGVARGADDLGLFGHPGEVENGVVVRGDAVAGRRLFGVVDGQAAVFVGKSKDVFVS